MRRRTECKREKNGRDGTGIGDIDEKKGRVARAS